jgi:hypothetical protein
LGVVADVCAIRDVLAEWLEFRGYGRVERDVVLGLVLGDSFVGWDGGDVLGLLVRADGLACSFPNGRLSLVECLAVIR